MTRNLPKCAWCQQQPVKRRKHACCSPSCASQKRWNEMSTDERGRRLLGGRQAAYKNERTKRIVAETTREIERLGIQNCCGDDGGDMQRIVRLYVRARNIGYNAGYQAAAKRARSGLI